MRLFVGNLPYSVDDAELKRIFSEYGDVTDAKVIYERDTNRSRGFGFVEMDDDGGKDAILALNDTEVQGRPLTVNEAKPREDRSGNGGPRRKRTR